VGLISSGLSPIIIVSANLAQPPRPNTRASLSSGLYALALRRLHISFLDYCLVGTHAILGPLTPTHRNSFGLGPRVTHSSIWTVQDQALLAQVIPLAFLGTTPP
jgi:hypothetical protein